MTYATPKHVFLHLMMIAMLYISVIAFITLCFQYANLLWLDVALDYQRDSINNHIRWSSSALIVAYPMLLVMTWLLQKEFKQQPSLRDMKTRRWLLYFTQFLTAITIIIDLMILIYEFYGGEITARFISKVIVILVVAAVVLGYYLWELRRTAAPTLVPKITAITVGLVLLGSLIAGFFIAGNPLKQRDLRLDTERLNGLMSVQESVLNFTQSQDQLPADQTALELWSGTPENYHTYTKLSDTSFQLCATFATDQAEGDVIDISYYPPYPDKASPQLVGDIRWAHPAGYYCFDRTIELAD